MAEQNENESIECHWVNWCRLCAKDDVLGNVKVDSSEEGTDWNSVLLMAIRKYFDVHMRPEDELSGVICKECYTLISELIDFAERVNKVQAIFEVLRHSEPNKMLDVKALRQQYALQDGDWTHIIKPVSDIDNNVSKQAVIAEEFPVEMLAPKQEFLNLSQEMEDEQPNPLDQCEEPIVSQLPTEEIFVERCDAKATSQNSSLKRRRGRPKKHSTNTDKGDKPVSDLNEDLPNDSANQLIPISDTAEPEVPETSSSPDWTHMFKPVSDIDNNVSKQDVTAEEFPVEMLMPKQEFLNLSYEMEDEQPNPLDHCEEPIVSQLPTEEILDERCDAKATSQISSLKRRRGRPKKNSKKGNKSVSNLNEDLPNDSANQLLSRSDTAEPEVPDASPSPKCDDDELNSSKRRKLKCKWCSKLYHNPKSYEKHLRVGCRKVEPRAKVDKNTFCNICNKTLSSAAAFKLHMEGMHDNVKPFVCDHCGKQLKSLTALNEHKLVHTEDRPFKCTMCDACFKNNARLRVHYQIHKDPNYICNICGKKLQTRRTWNQHKLVHVEERRFKCDVCSALFKRSKTLKTHLLIHAGMRPYVCKYCGQTFSCNANCRAHKMKRHAKEVMEEENEDFPNRLSVPSLDELRVMSQILPKSLQLSKKG